MSYRVVDPKGTVFEVGTKKQADAWVEVGFRLEGEGGSKAATTKAKSTTRKTARKPSSD